MLCAQYSIWLSQVSFSNCLNTSIVCPHNKKASSFPGVSCNSIGNVVSIQFRSDYSFSGEILSSIGNLTAVTSLDLGGYGLQGTLPDSLFQMTSLVRLQLSWNSLSGTLPTEVKMPSLLGINLAHNSFEGTIPDSLFNLPNLESLDLSFNSFTGYIPSAIGNLSSLLVLNMEFNNFVGNIPQEVCNLTLLEGLYVCTTNKHFANLNFYFKSAYTYAFQYASANENDTGCSFIQGVPRCVIQAPQGPLRRLSASSKGLGNLITISEQQGNV